MVEAAGRMTLPIACTLGPTDGAVRMREWQALLASHHISTDRRSGYLEVRFRDDGTTRGELERLVEAERDCCSFVEWSVADGSGELVLTISGEDAALETFSF